MKLALLFVLFSINSWARPIIVVSYFDAFGKAPFNNSEKVAKILGENLKNHPAFELKLCSLSTVFDKSYYQLEDCVKALPEIPKLVLGLGESNCNLKIEILGRNLDRTKGPDNEGNERNNSVIIPDAPKEFGFNYPLPAMYCSLPNRDRSGIEVSNNAGSFVCNNMAYQFAYNYPEIESGFIHVPAHFCRNLESKTAVAVKNLEGMIAAAAESKTVMRLPVTKKEFEVLRDRSRRDKCLNEFYSRTKGVDEKGFWSFLETD
jgi:pyrrolidone-carboxylate peptidase